MKHYLIGWALALRHSMTETHLKLQSNQLEPKSSLDFRASEIQSPVLHERRLGALGFGNR